MANKHTGLEPWISSRYLQKSTIQNLVQTFPRQKPFPYLELKDFFHSEKAQAILKALLHESFGRQEADLFKFKQTNDFKLLKNKVLQEFRSFLSSPHFVAYLSQITSCTLKKNSIDISGTLYEDTDFLLCHDDQLEGRKIAFFYYLASLAKNDGGGLNLFATETTEKDLPAPTIISTTITPAFNTFAFFLVSEKSFHEVAEVLRPIQRIAISGWFHDQ